MMNPPWQPSHVTSIQVMQVNRQAIDEQWDARDVCSSFWRLYVNNRDGAFLLMPDGSQFPLSKRRIYLIPAWVRFSCLNTIVMDHFYIHFDMTGLPGVLIRQLFKEPMMLQTTRAMALILRYLKTMPWLDALQCQAVNCQLHALLNLAIAQAWDSLLPQQAEKCRDILHGPHQLTTVLQYIEEKLSMPLNNADLARRCNLSRDYFVRRFTCEIGQTPAHYIRERRIARAAQMLRFSQESLERIAQQCGFADRFHFSRVFSKIMGSPPAAYRHGKHV